MGVVVDDRAQDRRVVFDDPLETDVPEPGETGQEELDDNEEPSGGRGDDG